MPRRPNDEQEVIPYKAFPYQEQSYHNEKNSYEAQNRPNPYHWNPPKFDKNQQDDYNRNDSKNQLFYRNDTQESLSANVFSSRSAAGQEEVCISI